MPLTLDDPITRSPDGPITRYNKSMNPTHPEDIQGARRSRRGTPFGRMEKGDSGNDHAPERGDEATPVSADAAQPLSLFLSHGSPPRGTQELVHPPHGGTAAPDERARPGRTPLDRKSTRLN